MVVGRTLGASTDSVALLLYPLGLSARKEGRGGGLKAGTTENMLSTTLLFGSVLLVWYFISRRIAED